MALLLLLREIRAMQTQTKITDFIDEKPEVIVRAPEAEGKGTLEQILERLERIEAMLSEGRVTASVSVSRPLAGGPPVRPFALASSSRRPSAQATELRELMGVPDGEVFVSTSKEILAALRARRN